MCIQQQEPVKLRTRNSLAEENKYIKNYILVSLITSLQKNCATFNKFVYNMALQYNKQAQH
jgi:hypothetical protein